MSIDASTTDKKSVLERSHDPFKQLGYLQQCLSSNKKPLALFLGAGCPVAVKTGDAPQCPLIPDIAGLTSRIRECLSGPFLTAVEGYFSQKTEQEITVEDILSHIRALRAVVGSDEIRGLSAKDLDCLDDAICNVISEVVTVELPDKTTPYHQIASWIDAVGREYPVEIFTPNYDLLVEQALEDHRVPYFDGFSGSRNPFFDLRAMEQDVLPARWARLWKLHGSINWYQDDIKGVFRSAIGGNGAHRVIHPSHLKYDESRRMPYLAMQDRLRTFLRRPTSMMVICGYSFRDDHINEVILQGLQSTQTAIAFALLFGPLANYPKAKKLAIERPNLTLLADDAAVISGREGNWMEKEAESLTSDATAWVTWQALDPENSPTKQAARLRLGDFAVFGQFAHELIEHTRTLGEVNNAQ